MIRVHIFCNFDAVIVNVVRIFCNFDTVVVNLDRTSYGSRFRLIMITQLIWCTFTILYVSAYMFGSDIATYYIMES